MWVLTVRREMSRHCATSLSVRPIDANSSIARCRGLIRTPLPHTNPTIGLSQQRPTGRMYPGTLDNWPRSASKPPGVRGATENGESLNGEWPLALHSGNGRGSSRNSRPIVDAREIDGNEVLCLPRIAAIRLARHDFNVVFVEHARASVAR
jgi:hypothetical protein